MESLELKSLNVAGPSFEDFAMEEMISMQGVGDVQPDSSVSVAVSVTVTINLTFSAICASVKWC